MLEGIGSADAWIALATLSAMEIVLGIDNIVFITILVGRLPPEKRDAARRLGIGAALISRLGLLFALSWIMRLTAPLFSIAGRGFSGRDLILIGGGLFLIAKATKEIHHKLEGGGEEADGKASTSAAMVIAQIMVVDVVFSLDSVITAVGMADQLWVMVTAMMLAVGVMLAFARAIGDFVERHPSVKVLGLSFLLLIGVTLVADGLGQHVSKGYIYAAMGFSLFVEVLNMRSTRKKEPVHLRTPYEEAPPAAP